jgi:hypothetical protein
VTPRPGNRFGNCYVSSEALYHILGGKRAGWTPMRLRLGEGCVHWFLRHSSGLILDPARLQFRAKQWWAPPDYSKARGSGFLTKRPSARARRLMKRLTWSHDNGLTDRL